MNIFGFHFCMDEFNMLVNMGTFLFLGVDAHTVAASIRLAWARVKRLGGKVAVYP